ncbi:hypothetical protein PO124_19905 [Bacillus licheniformis]|nr:hypothetical protein [Bacillus licheniformis]
MADAYTTFGNNGSYTSSHAITKVTDLKENAIQMERQAAASIQHADKQPNARTLSSGCQRRNRKKANFSGGYVGGKPEHPTGTETFGLSD